MVMLFQEIILRATTNIQQNILTPCSLIFYGVITLSLRTELGAESQTKKKKKKIKQICFDFFFEYHLSSNTNKTCLLIKTVVKYSSSLCD